MHQQDQTMTSSKSTQSNLNTNSNPLALPCNSTRSNILINHYKLKGTKINNKVNIKLNMINTEHKVQNIASAKGQKPKKNSDTQWKETTLCTNKQHMYTCMKLQKYMYIHI